MTKQQYDLISTDFFRNCNLTLEPNEARMVYRKFARILFALYLKGLNK